MNLGALCLLIFLTGCALATPPTGPEQTLVETMTQKEACDAPEGFSGLQHCNLYIVLDDQSLHLVTEVESGIPYVGHRTEFGMVRGERYALWLAGIAAEGRDVVAYLGPYDDGYDLATWNYSGQS